MISDSKNAKTPDQLTSDQAKIDHLLTVTIAIVSSFSILLLWPIGG